MDTKKKVYMHTNIYTHFFYNKKVMYVTPKKGYGKN